MKHEKYLIVEEYKGKKIKILVDEVWEFGILVDASIFNYLNSSVHVLGTWSGEMNKNDVTSVNYLTEYDVCELVLNEIKNSEKLIDKMKNFLYVYEKSNFDFLSVYSIYCGTLIEVRVIINFYKNEVTWFCMGQTHYCPIGSALSSIKNNIQECKYNIEHLHFVKKCSEQKRGYTLELLKIMKESLRQNVLIKKYPELFR